MYAITSKVQLIGKLHGVPEIDTVESGEKRARFILITTNDSRDIRGRKSKSENRHNIVAFGKVADIVEKYANDKGKEWAVEGVIAYHKFKDKDGTTRQMAEIQANEILILGRQ